MIIRHKFLHICFLFLFISFWNGPVAQSVNGHKTRMHTIRLSEKVPQATDREKGPLVGFVNFLPFDKASDETRSAFAFLQASQEFAVEFITLKEIEKKPKNLSRYACLWIHGADTAGLGAEETDMKFIKILSDYVIRGGRVLLTQQAVHYLNFLGFEQNQLTDSVKSCVDEGYGRKLGFHSFRDHPLFCGLNGGAYVCRPVSDMKTRITGFFGDRIPRNGKVIAVDWDYIFLREQSKLVLEYNTGGGRIVAVGGYMIYGIPNLNRAHLELFTANCFKYLMSGNSNQPGHYWDYSLSLITPVADRPQTDRPLAAVPPSVKWEEPADPLMLKNMSADRNFWDVAGERMVTMGSERGGIDEIWAHPFMALKNYEVGIRLKPGDTIHWISQDNPDITVHPGYFSRLYTFPRAFLKEIIVNSPEDPAGVVHYEYQGAYVADLIIRYRSNLRLMWPYSEKATGTVFYSWDPDLDAAEIHDREGFMSVKIGGTRKAAHHFEGQFDGFDYNPFSQSYSGRQTDIFQVEGLLEYHLEKKDILDIVYTATNEGYAENNRQFDNLIRDPLHVFDASRDHVHAVLLKDLMITTPDPGFNLGYRWALLAADRFFVNTPGMGRALVAGYATTRHGWDGGHKVNGRPGYAWYFGRDGEWSSYALLDCGDFRKVRAQLEFFNRYQDLSGKIFHEASTSGFIHYDAADATPLYIVLAGKYFRHTNDYGFIRTIWPNIKKAIDFCYSTDTDQDHLIENTQVGHGWVESGELYGSHATLYMAGSWGAALSEASSIAASMGDSADAVKYRKESAIVKQVINRNFWSDSHRFYAYGKNLDGSFRWEPTVLPAVPVYFRMTDPDKAALCMKQYASNEFSTNWGVRILREDSPLFKPGGYHYGSVWPLFTGWTSLAEYATGNSLQGFSHLMNNLNLYKNWGLGLAEEVLNGAEYRPSGVCAHQCWSETMILQPAIEGMLGLGVNTQENKVVIAPKLPVQWDSLDVRNIKADERILSFHFQRREGSQDSVVMTYDFTLENGKPLNIEFMPYLPPATKITGITMNGKPLAGATVFTTDQSLVVLANFMIGYRSTIVIEAGAGISALPVVPDPRPGSSAAGMRIISTRISGDGYTVEVEGKSGSKGTLEIYSPGRKTETAVNATFLNRDQDISRFTVEFDKSETKYAVKTVSVKIDQ